ncbi:MAG TPA: 4Fe-4S binding protein [Beijerinckiaceae bacterium]|nr:4Fe-4S binding protein [Beijerinckiaceae bacterium]
MAFVETKPQADLTGRQGSGVGLDRALARAGDWLMRHQGAIRRVQWFVVLAYVFLLAAPAALPLPTRAAHIWSNLTLFAQFVFWGLWWPFVLLSMALVGRSWCGLLCPEGALTEAVSAHGWGRAAPRWLTWGGWPFVAFAGVTVYGQMISVYQYPGPALVILGGSTVAAMAVGYLWGRNKRIWCRYLCPVTGVFGLLSKLAPIHFRVDQQAWRAWTKPRGTHPQTVNCAPLVPIKTMRGATLCHMCGRCSGFRDGAVTLARRSPNHEIVHVAGERTKPWETALISFGLMGLAGGAFHWVVSDAFVTAKQALAGFLIAHNATWLLNPILPWFVLTNYPARNDVMTPLDGIVLLGYLFVFASAIGLGVNLCLAGATRLTGRWSWPRFHHLAQALIPIAGAGVFLGLSSLTVTMLRAEGLYLGFVDVVRGAVLIGASAWTIWLAWGVSGRYAPDLVRRTAATVVMGGAAAIGAFVWASLFWTL